MFAVSAVNYALLLPPVITNRPPGVFYSQLFSGGELRAEGGEIIKVDAKSSDGFNYDYFLFIPDTAEAGTELYLLVEPNNTGTVSDDIRRHEDDVRSKLSSLWFTRLARDLGAPLLVPVFPRPESDWRVYTHSLDRDTVYTQDGELARIDRQLISMMEDVKALLESKGYLTRDKVLLNGFSASGSFVNRFTALYPELVKAVAAGGVNSMPILPLETHGGTDLIYPIGVADNSAITGRDFEPASYGEVHQFIYMGAEDHNDTLEYSDAFDDFERDIIVTVMGRGMRRRWELAKELYAPYGRAELRLYEGVGHTVTDEIYADCLEFFRRALDRK